MKKFLIISLLLSLLAIPVQADNVKYATVFHPVSGHRKAVVVGDPYAFKGGYMLETSYNYILQNPDQLGFTVVTNYKTTLSRSISSTASTIYVSSLTTKDGQSLTMANLGTKVFFTLEPGSNKEEIVMATGVGTLSWTGVTRGLSFYGTSTAAVTANQKSHSAGSAIVMSNVHYVYDELVDKDTADTIDGLKTFTATTTFSKLPNTTSSYTPSADGDLSTKKYVDDTALASAPDATASVKGVTELATGAEAAAGASAGGTTGGLVLPASIATTTANVAGNHVAVTDTDGKLKQDLLDLTDSWTQSGNNTFSGNNTLSATTTFNGLTLNPRTINAYTASTTISGNATPQAVYIATTTGAIQLSNAAYTASSTYYMFDGFAINDSVNGGTAYVQTDGIVSGFSGLTMGKEYYVSNTAGTISATMGNVPLKIGRAISATQILITHQKKWGIVENKTIASDGVTFTAYTDGVISWWQNDTATGITCSGTVTAPGGSAMSFEATAVTNSKSIGGTMPVGRGDYFVVTCTSADNGYLDWRAYN